MRASEIRQRFADIVAAHNINHLVFCGAHEGEEVPYLLAAGVGRLTLIEPIPHLAAKLRATYPTATVIQAACSDRAGTATLHIPKRTNMATLVETDGDTITVPTARLDALCPDADAAVVDVQGHEMQVLAAAPWGTLRLVMVETCTVDDPTLSPPYEQVVDLMTGRGLREIARLTRDYDWIQRWAYGRITRTGAEVRDVVFTKTTI